MSDTAKIVAALRDMAAKVQEMQTREVPDHYEALTFQQHGRPTPMRVEEHPKYGRGWLSGRLLGMADALEALTTEG
jgi:hypothetical protein